MPGGFLGSKAGFQGAHLGGCTQACVPQPRRLRYQAREIISPLGLLWQRYEMQRQQE